MSDIKKAHGFARWSVSVLPIFILALISTIAFASEKASIPPLELDIDSALAIALKDNSDLAIARLKKKSAIERKNEALGAAFPDVNLDATYRYDGNVQKYELAPGQSLQFSPTDNYSYGAKVDQWIYSGSVFSAMRGARHYMAIADNDLSAVKNLVVADVKIKFYNAFYRKDLIKVHEESIDQLKRHLEDSKTRGEVGLATHYDAQRFETELASVIPLLIQAKNDHGRAVAALLESLGINPLLRVNIKGGLEEKPKSITLKDAVEQAINNRPELVAAKENTLLAREITNAAEGDMWPTLKAFGAYKRSNSELTEAGDFDWRDEWNVGLKVELNLFNGWRTRSRIGQRKVDEAIARLNEAKARRAVLIEVKTSYDQFIRSKEFIQSQETSVSYAEETYRIMNERRNEGVATQLELLDAQLSLTKAKINHTRSLYEYSVAKARLELAVGEANVGGER